MRARVLFAGAIYLLALPACGSSGVGSRASSALKPDVVAVKDAASRGDTGAAQAALDQLRANVAKLEGAGSLSPAAARRVLEAANEVAGQLPTLAPTASTALTPTSSATPTAATPPEPGRHHDKGNGGDNGNGD